MVGLVLGWPVASAQAQSTTVLDVRAGFNAAPGPIPAEGGDPTLFIVDESHRVVDYSGPDRFHIFDRFDVASGDTVRWQGGAAPRNIFNLVVDENRSQINGTLASDFDSDIYLINPDGILFGPDARLDVGGSFFASTADRIEFEDAVQGVQLDLDSDSLDGTDFTTLTTADFAEFGFLDANRSIRIDGAQLVVDADATLGLYAARNVRIEIEDAALPATIRAGRVEISADTGDVRLLDGRILADRGAVADGSGVDIDADEEFELSGGSGIESTGDFGVRVRARTIELDDRDSEILSLAPDVTGGDIELDARQRVLIRDRSRVASEATGTGVAGDVRIEGRDLLLLDASIESRSESGTNGQGEIDLAIDRVANVVDGRIESQIDDAGAGDIRIAAPLVVLQGDSRVAARSARLAVETDLLVRSGEAELEGASVEISGSEIVRNLQTDLNERLEVLPQHFFERRVRLDKTCAARSGEALGSLVIDPQRIAEDRPHRLRHAFYATQREALEAAGTPLGSAIAWNPLPDWFERIEEPTADDWLALAQRGERRGNLEGAADAAARGIRQTRDPAERAALHAVRARVRAQLDQHGGSDEDFSAATAFAQESGEATLLANVWLDRGTTALRRGEWDEGLRSLEAAFVLAGETGARETRLAAEANVISGLLAAGRAEAARSRLDNHFQTELEVTGNEREMSAALHIALAAIRAGQRQAGADRLIELAGQALASDRPAIVALAWAYLAGLYAEEDRLDDAIELTRWAIEASLGSHERTRLASLEVQLADLLRDTGDLAGAVRNYRMALQAMPVLVRGGPQRLSRDPFHEIDGVDEIDGLGESTEQVGIATSLVDVILRSAARTPDRERREALVREARAAVEAERVRELRDHFRDPCIHAMEKVPADSVPGAVVVHPVPLDDRLALIVSSEAGLRAYDVPVARDELLDVVAETERAVGNRTTNRYRRGAAQLYDWMIRPLEDRIRDPSVETLVFVTGGPLRGFPMAALYDRVAGEFLIEKVAVAATPGLSLTRPRPMVDRALVMLRAGLDGGADEAGNLPTVRRELDALSRMFAGVELRGEAFVPKKLEQALEQQSFDVVHIASHGVFPTSGEAPHLVTAGVPLELDDLASMLRRTRFRDRPTELITLSACETAVSHEQAALGLAGLAIRSGARSTVATLWRVNDEASADFMEHFYAALASRRATRAGALREAQLRFLENPVLSHPYFWAPYLLLGNWQ